ncbi:MAG TPA: carbohydrate ABC transporter permease [Mycobacteriales bacterium]|nr:carbohydrate ABC transporter permease [Mycobacteriales bacterium]
MLAGNRVVRWIGVAFILLWSLIPIYWAINTSLKHEVDAVARPAHYLPTNTTFQNFRTILGLGGDSDLAHQIRRSILNIFIECGAATIVTVAIAVLASYAFARMTFRFGRVLFYSVLVTMTFPAYTTLIPLYRIMADLRLVNTYTGIVLVYVSGFLPLATWILYNYFSSLPRSLEEAGLVDGASRMQVLWNVVLPLARPGIASTAIITFLAAWAQFLFPLVLASDISTEPLTVVITSLQTRHTIPLTLLNSAGVLAIIVPAVIALLLNRYIINGLLAGSVK